jgi:hypothetical protein
MVNRVREETKEEKRCTFVTVRDGKTSSRGDKKKEIEDKISRQSVTVIRVREEINEEDVNS